MTLRWWITSLYWLTCTTFGEACYLTAIINSSQLAIGSIAAIDAEGSIRCAACSDAHLASEAIPEFDGEDSLHMSINRMRVGDQAANGVELELVNLRQRYPKLTVTIARREIRKWLRRSRRKVSAWRRLWGRCWGDE